MRRGELHLHFFVLLEFDPEQSMLRNAARQGDAHGDVPAAITVLEAGLARHPDATTTERLQAQLG